MSNNIWRCRCGKRVEVLTDENFGDCGCSDPVYGPEYFYMSKECADMLDEMDKDYDEQHKQLSEARAEIERLKSEHEDSLRKAKDNAASLSGTVTEYAGELFAKGKLIEQMLEALEVVVRVADRATVDFDMARVAIKAAKEEIS